MDSPSNLSIDYLDLLPDEVLLEILIKTDDLDTLSRWCQTSKRINNICQDKVLWKQKYLKDFGLSCDTILTEGDTWQELYKQMVLFGINSPISIDSGGYGIIDQKGNLYMTGAKAILGIGQQPQIGRFSRKQHLVKFPSKYKNGNLYNLSQKVVSISVNYCSVGAVTADGKVYVWGGNSYDKFGIGEEIKEIDLPRELILPSRSDGALRESVRFIALPRKAIRIEVSMTGYIILLEDFTVYLRMFNTRFVKAYFRYIIDFKIIDMSISGNMYLVITKDHELYMGGDIFQDEPYMPNKPDLSIKLISLKFPKQIKRAIIVDYFVMILSITGKVYTQKYYDDYSYGQTMFSKTKPELIKLPEPIVQIYVGGDTYAALSETGKLYMWGSNDENQISSDLIGYKSRTGEILEPVEISFGLPINFVSVGSNSTIAVSNDGSVNHWGDPWLSPE